MIIDCDSHFIPPDTFDYVEGKHAKNRPVLMFDDQGLLRGFEFPGKPPQVSGTTPPGIPGTAEGDEFSRISGFYLRGNSDIEARLADFEKMGIQSQVLLPQFDRWWSYLLEPELGKALARSWNTAIWKLTQKYRGRVYGVGLVPLQDVEAAIDELRWASERGFHSVLADYIFPVTGHPYGEPLGHHRELWPFWAEAERLNMPISIHIIQHGHKLSNLPMLQTYGIAESMLHRHVDKQMTMASLITSGLLDDFPKLKFLQVETGTAYLIPMIQYMDKVFERRAANKAPSLFMMPADAAPRNKLPPSHYFRNNFYWTIETEEPELVEAMEFLGADRFLFSTDYPHDDPGGLMKFKDVELLAANPRISEADKDLIRSGNAATLFKLV